LEKLKTKHTLRSYSVYLMFLYLLYDISIMLLL